MNGISFSSRKFVVLPFYLIRNLLYKCLCIRIHRSVCVNLRTNVANSQHSLIDSRIKSSLILEVL